jgi:hypothetical protein
MLDDAPAEFRARILAADEVEQQRLFRDAYADFLREQPGDALALWARKLLYAWWFSPVSGAEHPGWALPLYRPYYVLAAVLAVAGVVSGLRRGPRLLTAMLVACLAAISAGQAVFFVEGRHRLVLMPVVLALAVLGAVRLTPRSGR